MDGKMKWDEQSGFVPAYDSAIMTNGDRFRSMSDEELADELLEWYAVFSAVEWTKDMIIDWLKQEADNGK